MIYVLGAIWEMGLFGKFLEILGIMSPIVLFIISFNLCLSCACVWMAYTIVQWQKSLTQINQSLTIAEHHLRTRPQNSTDPALNHLQTQAQQLRSQLQPQLVPLLQILSSLYRIQRLWSRMGLRSPASKSTRRINLQQSARNPRKR